MILENEFLVGMWGKKDCYWIFVYSYLVKWERVMEKGIFV